MADNRVLCDGVPTSFLPINRKVAQGTIINFWGSLIIVVYDIKSFDNSGTLLVKYPDDITVSTHRSNKYDSSDLEVNAIKKINGLS